MVGLLLGALLVQDSAAAVRSARQAQDRFEVVRRSSLPPSLSSGAGRCEERIGRFCYWYDPEDPPHPEEPAVIVRARGELLQRLAVARAEAPGDPWVTGQLVRYLLEAGRLEEAVQAARGCRAQPSWCSALAGLSLHLAGEAAAADSAFSAALLAMTTEERCLWIDLSLLLTGESARQHRRLPCHDRIAEAERVLALSRPLLSRPGNPVRGAFLARQTMVRLLQGTTTPHGYRFGADQRELVLRYGWPVGWSRLRGPDPFREGGVTGHDHSPAWAFLPLEIAHPTWELHPRRARARFRPPGVDHFQDLVTAQLARFPRGDRVLLVAAWRAPADSVFAGSDIESHLAAEPDATAPTRHQSLAGVREGFLTLWAPARTTMAGVELGARSGRAWARYRVVWPERPDSLGPRLSDLLLFDPGQGVPDRLEEVLPVALRGHALPRGVALGLYWEASRLPPRADSGEVHIRIRRAPRGGVLQAWSWQGPIPRSGAFERSVALDLPRLGRGRYVVEVVVEVAGERATASRPFRIE